MSDQLNRRQFLHHTGLTAGLAGAAGASLAATTGCETSAVHRPHHELGTAERAFRYQGGLSPWPICMDTSTIRSAETLDEKIEICARTGWDGMEIWEGELNEYEQEVGSLPELRRKLNDHGLQVPNVIALWNAFPQTDEEFENGLDAQRRRMRQAAEIGATNIQAVGVPDRPWQEFDLEQASRHYRRLLEIGLEDYNIRPAVMFLQFLPHLQRMGQASAVAIDADHPRAAIVPDVFHMYSGGTGFNALKHVQGDFLAVFQINDVPDDPSRDQLEDEHRIFPGDGILPLEQALRDVWDIGFRGAVSLQLFNREYWERDLMEVGREGLDKTVHVVARAMGKA